MPKWSDFIDSGPAVDDQPAPTPAPSPAPSPAPAATNPAAGGRWSRFIEGGAPPAATSTYHRDRLANALAQDQNDRQTMGRDYRPLRTAEEWSQMHADAAAEDAGKQSAGAEAQSDLVDNARRGPALRQQEAQRTAAMTPDQRAAADEGKRFAAPDTRGLWDTGTDLVQATGRGARTGAFDTLAGIDTTLNAVGALSDETTQNMHELAEESRRKSNLDGAQGTLAKGAEFVTGSVGYLDPVLAPVIAAGQGRRAVLAATSEDGTLASGDQTKANIVGLASAAGALAAGPAGRAVEGTLAKTAPAALRTSAESLTAGTSFMAPEPIAAAAVAGQDARLQEQAQAGIEGLPANVAGLTAGVAAVRLLPKIGAEGRRVAAEEQRIDQMRQNDAALAAQDPATAAVLAQRPPAADAATARAHGAELERVPAGERIWEDTDKTDTIEQQRAATALGRDLSLADQQVLANRALKAQDDAALRQMELSDITDKALGEKPRTAPVEEVPDLAAQEAQRTLAEQQRIQAENQERDDRRKAFLLREDLRNHEETGSVYGRHYYDERGRLQFDPDAQNQAATEVGLDRSKAFIRRVLGEDEGSFAADDPTATKQVIQHRMTEKELPPEMAKGVRTSSYEAPTAESIAALPPKRRIDTLRNLPPEVRQRLVPEVAKIVRERGAIHGFNDNPGKAKPRPAPIAQEPPHASQLRKDQGAPAQEGNVGPRRQEPRGPDAQRPAESVRPASGAAPEVVRSPPAPATAPEVSAGSDRPAGRRLNSVKVNSIDDLHRGLREVYGLPEDHAAAAIALVRARAASLGVHADVFARQRISEVRQGKGDPLLNQRGQRSTMLEQDATRIIPRDQSLAFQHLKRQWEKAHGERAQPGTPTWQDLQVKAAKVDAARGILYQEDRLRDAPQGRGSEKGAISFAEDGRAVLHALKAPDVSTAVHELGHLFRRTLTEKDMEIAGRWAGARNGTWGRAAEERFARAFERYLRDGQAPFAGLKSVFEKFKNWMSAIYQSIRGSPIDIHMSPEIRQVFDRMLTPAKGHEGEVDVPTARPEPVAERQNDSVSRETVTESAKSSNVREASGPEQVAPDAQRTKPAPSKGNSRPDLATPTMDQRTRDAYEQARNNIPPDEVRNREETRAQAAKDVKADPQGILKRIMDLHDQQQPLSDLQVAQAAELLPIIKRRHGDASPEFQRLALAYHVSGSNTSRAMGIRADQVKTPEGRLREAQSLAALPRDRRARAANKLREEITKLSQQADLLFQKSPDTAQRAKNRIKKLQAKLDALHAQDAKIYARDKAHLKELGYDLDQANPDWAENPQHFAHFLGALEATRGGLPAAAREFYTGILHTSGLISGKKIIADTIGIPIKTIIRHLEAAQAGVKRAVTGKELPEQASAAELGILWSKLLPNLKRSASNGWETFKTEKMPPELTGEEEMHHFPAIRGIKGKVLRTVFQFRTVRAIDSFSRSFIANMEAHAHAYRSAVDADGHRMKGQDLEHHIAKELADYTSDSWAKARAEGMEGTFMEKPPSWSGAGFINRLKFQKANSIPAKAMKLLANIMFPFTTIPTNIVNQGLRDWTPGLSEAGIMARALTRRATTGEWGYDPNKFNIGVAKAAIRWSGMLALGQLASQGIITGESDERNPFTIHLFGHQFSYQHLGPLARLIGAAADWYGPNKDMAAKARAGRVLAGSAHMLAEAPMIRFMEDLHKASSRNDGWNRYAADKVGGLVDPAIIHQVYTSQQDEVRAKQKAKGDGFDRFLGYLHDRLTTNKGKPVMIEGRPLVKDSFDSDVGTVMWRMFSPFTLGNKEPGKER